MHSVVEGDELLVLARSEEAKPEQGSSGCWGSLIMTAATVRVILGSDSQGQRGGADWDQSTYWSSRALSRV